MCGGALTSLAWFAKRFSNLIFSHFKYKSLSRRAEQQQPRVHMETPQPQPDTTAVRSVSRSQQEYDDDEDEYDENEAAPDLEKDDMMARRTRSSQKPPAAKTNQCYSRFQFLPVPGSVKYNVSPVSAMKPLHVRPKRAEKSAGERYSQCLMKRLG